MNLRIVRAAIDSEKADEAHQARLLLLLNQAAEKKGRTVDGITKLAKLDFLLRYPLYFKRLLERTRKRPPAVTMRSYEADTVESKMIRFRYGPWDPRYRRWIGLLVAQGLANTYLKGRTVHVEITAEGQEVAREIAATEEFEDLNERSKEVVKAVGGWSGSKLKDTVYEVVPELTGLAWGDRI